MGTISKSTLLDAPAIKLPATSQPPPVVVVQIHPAGPNLGRRFALTAVEHVVGREPDLDISVDSDTLSRRHARLVKAADGWWLEDLGSTNGSYVNDERVERRVLCDGDRLRFGGAIFKFLSGDNVEAAYHEEIYKMSIVDGLTGVHNKRYFVEFLDRQFAGALRHRLPLSLVMFDIDHFKKINDARGHLAGDAVLKELARRLKPRIRRDDLLARYGGEEFVAVLNNTPGRGAAVFAESLRRLVAATPFDHEATPIEVTISLGVADLDHARDKNPNDLVQRADQNLYAAKRAGRDRVVG